MPNNPPLTIVVRVEGGKIKTHNPSRWQMIMRHFENKDAILSLEQWTDKRSINQNSLYWYYLHQIEVDTGNDANAMHAYFKHKFIPTKLVTIYGETVSADKTTTGLNKKEFSDYLDKICALTGVPIPSFDQ